MCSPVRDLTRSLSWTLCNSSSGLLHDGGCVETVPLVREFLPSSPENTHPHTPTRDIEQIGAGLAQLAESLRRSFMKCKDVIILRQVEQPKLLVCGH